MSTVADYAGRTVDVLALRKDTAGQLVGALASSSDGGALVAGVVKLAQRFLLLLETELGLLTYLPKTGCLFLSDARAGRWRSAADVQQSFYSAVFDVRRQLAEEAQAGDPDDERLEDAALLAVTLDRGNVAVTIQLTSAAGASRTIIRPIRVPIK